MKTIFQKSEYASTHLLTNSPKEVKALLTALKKLSKDCSLAGINTQPLTKLLLTIYANIAISKGLAATLKEKLNQSPTVMNRDNMTELSHMILDEMWEIESMLTELSQCLDTGNEQ